jgi:L-fuconolactonase
VVERFGARRLLYGSDWPVCTLAASYAEVLEVAERFVGGSAGVFGENADALYGLSSAADG